MQPTITALGVLCIVQALAIIVIVGRWRDARMRALVAEDMVRLQRERIALQERSLQQHIEREHDYTDELKKTHERLEARG